MFEEPAQQCRHYLTENPHLPIGAVEGNHLNRYLETGLCESQ